MAAQGAYIFGCSGPRLTREERDFFRDTCPWGFILFARNVQDPEQLRWLTAEIREAAGHDAPIFIDQEGGRVARLTPPHWRDWLPALDQVNLNRKAAPRSMYLRYRIIADELTRVGIDGNCAPLLDLVRPDTHDILNNRCYGDDVVHVAEIAGAVATGLIEGGVLPVVKHIPGHGRATADSHLELPRVSAKAKALRVSDFLAFESVAGLPLAMTAHVVYEDIDPERPATTSPVMMALIREKIGFGGLVMSDDISMQALSGPLAERSKAALAAGCDVILHCNGDMADMVEVAEASGRMSPAAQARADGALTWRRPPEPHDIKAMEDELDALLRGAAV